jgi:serine/threonine protein kinase
MEESYDHDQPVNIKSQFQILDIEQANPLENPRSFFNIDRIDSMRRLAVAGQSTVYQVRYKDMEANESVIFKIYREDSGAEEATREYELSKELKTTLQRNKGILGETCSDFILDYDYEPDINPNILISQFIGGINDAYKSHRKPIASIRDIDGLLSFDMTGDTVISTLSSIIHCIHQVGFYHRDIKPDNFIITHDKRVFLIDFGMSIKADEVAHDTPSIYSTIQYRSPFMKEFDDATTTIEQKKTMLQANDLWALILTIFYFFIGGRHWHTLTNYKVAHQLAYSSIINDIMSTDPTTYVDNQSVIGFYRRYFYLEGRGKPKMTPERYISIIRRLMRVEGSRGGLTIKRTRKVKHKRKPTAKHKRKPTAKHKRKPTAKHKRKYTVKHKRQHKDINKRKHTVKNKRKHKVTNKD